MNKTIIKINVVGGVAHVVSVPPAQKIVINDYDSPEKVERFTSSRNILEVVDEIEKIREKSVLILYRHVRMLLYKKFKYSEDTLKLRDIGNIYLADEEIKLHIGNEGLLYQVINREDVGCRAGRFAFLRKKPIDYQKDILTIMYKKLKEIL